MLNRRVAMIVASVVTLVFVTCPDTSASLFGPRNRFPNVFFIPGVDILEEPDNQTPVTSPTSAATPAPFLAVKSGFDDEDHEFPLELRQKHPSWFRPRDAFGNYFGDQCPGDFFNEYEKNEDICRRCTEYYDNDARMGRLCRQNCFTNCYYVRCKNLLECHMPYPPMFRS